jgi:hypothetical protein
MTEHWHQYWQSNLAKIRHKLVSLSFILKHKLARGIPTHPVQYIHIFSSRNPHARMRPPTRSTRSVRAYPTKTATNARRSRGTSGPPTPLVSSETGNTDAAPLPNPRPPQRVSAGDEEEAKVDPGTSPGSRPQASTPPPVIGCFPVFPPPAAATLSTTFVFEIENDASGPVDPHNAGSTSPLLPIMSENSKPPPPPPPPRPLPRHRHRHRHRMSSENLEMLDAIFRRNTHPSRKEKEAICKDLDV